jgi:hypothetical protein
MIQVTELEIFCDAAEQSFGHIQTKIRRILADSLKNGYRRFESIPLRPHFKHNYLEAWATEGGYEAS